MTTLAVQWILDSDNGNPADKVMNTWHFKTDDGGTAEDAGAECVARLQTFYSAIDQYYSAFLSGAGLARVFDLSDPEPRVPVNELPVSITPSTASGLPCEVACCLSYQAPRISGTPQARRRGRVYLGPLAAGADALTPDSGSADMIVGADFRAAIASAASGLAGVWFGGGSAIAWCVYSPTDDAEGKTLSQSSNNVTDGWIDFAVDIQRRRGHAPGGRTLWTD